MTRRPEGHQEFDAWVRERARALQRFALLICGSPTEAQDLVQEALTRAWPRWESLVAQDTAEAYVRRSIVNGNISRWRKHRRTAVIAEVESFGSAPSAEQGVVDAVVAWEVCRELPRLQRAAVVLRFHEDLDFAEIARILDCAESTARSHVHRALRTLRARLGEVDDD